MRNEKPDSIECNGESGKESIVERRERLQGKEKSEEKTDSDYWLLTPEFCI